MNIVHKVYRASSSTGVPLRCRFHRGECPTRDEAQHRIRRALGETSLIWTVEREPAVIGA